MDSENTSEIELLLEQAEQGDQAVLGKLLALHQDRLARIVRLRLDKRLQGRLEAAQLVGHNTTPSEAAVRAELQLRLQEALDAMDPIDREVLVLRHFEQLTNAETAKVLGLRESAASHRYGRALLKLKDILGTMPGGLGGLRP